VVAGSGDVSVCEWVVVFMVFLSWVGVMGWCRGRAVKVRLLVTSR
jgi:hypothetical protein